MIIDCNNYKIQHNNNFNIKIIQTPIKPSLLGKPFYNKPYIHKTYKKVLPYITIKREHDYMWFSRHK